MGWALPSMAARQVTVAELQQLLVAQEATHKSDVEIAKKLSDLELTEELTPLTFQHIIAARRVRSADGSSSGTAGRCLGAARASDERVAGCGEARYGGTKRDVQRGGR